MKIQDGMVVQVGFGNGRYLFESGSGYNYLTALWKNKEGIRKVYRHSKHEKYKYIPVVITEHLRALIFIVFS